MTKDLRRKKQEEGETKKPKKKKKGMKLRNIHGPTEITRH